MSRLPLALGRVQFLPISLIVSHPSVAEVAPTEAHAQTLLEIYLFKYEKRCGEGMIQPLFLDQLFAYLSFGDVIIPSQLGETVNRLLIDIRILPKVVFAGEWDFIGGTVFQRFSLVNASHRNPVLNLAKFLTPHCRLVAPKPPERFRSTERAP